MSLLDLSKIAEAAKGAQRIADEFVALKAEVKALREEQTAMHETLKRIELCLLTLPLTGRAAA